ncbi:MAG: F0F1 ATP synthase subunit delta [Pseudomonadales bacterium]
MAELATLARPYANAVFEIALGAGGDALTRWSRMLQLLAAVAQQPGVERLLGSPDVADEQKARRLIEICGDDLDDRARRFVQVLARNKRLGLIADVAEQFEALRAEQERVLDVEVVSAYPLSDAQVERIKGALQARYSKEVSLSSSVDQSLIGGAVIRAGDTVIDGSVRGKLGKLAEVLQRS